jgi:nicotinamidase-related amidase
MRALIVIDVQNEFSEQGLRPVPGHADILSAIRKHIENAREKGIPIAWIRHHNLPSESPAFIPGSWGAEFSAGFGPNLSLSQETEFQKNVYGAFTGTSLGDWLRQLGITEVLVAGFYTHGCISTTCREAIMAGYEVVLDPEATGACDIVHPRLGSMTAVEVRRSALLQLVNMGAHVSYYFEPRSALMESISDHTWSVDSFISDK